MAPVEPMKQPRSKHGRQGKGDAGAADIPMAWAAENCWADGWVDWGGGFALALPTIMRGGMRGGREAEGIGGGGGGVGVGIDVGERWQRKGGGMGFFAGRAGTGGVCSRDGRRRWQMANERDGPSGRRCVRTDGERYYKK